MAENENEKQEAGQLLNLPLISVIVPVYQVKTYLKACVESLRSQTYGNLEIILVDDGSTDGSGEICDAYAGKDGRIRVIRQENRGLSAARNNGLDHAMGEYVAFVDSDDYVMPEYVEELYRLSLEYRADIAACLFVKVGDTNHSLSAQTQAGCNQRRDTGQKIGQPAKPEETMMQMTKHNRKKIAETEEICLSSERMLRRWHGRYKKWETVAWNKLYHRDVFESGAKEKTDGAEQSKGIGENGEGFASEQEKIRFPEGRKHEDVLTSHRIVEKTERIVMTTRVLYMYRMREGNITSKMNSVEGRRQNLYAQRERMQFFKERGYWRAYLNLFWGYVLHLGWFGWKAVLALWRSMFSY